MTELEKIRNAKLYIEKLARGINPINDAPVAEDELINDVHISRCFFFVAELLERFLATVGAEDAAAHRRLKKQPFSISEEQCGRFEYSPVPITVSEIARRLNIAAEVGDGSRLRYSSITFWLIETGMLAISKSPDGKETKRPTEQGAALGISTALRESAGGTYTVVVYGERAQRFIVANIYAVLEAEKLRFRMQGQPWRAEDDAVLRDCASRGVPIYEIALELSRNVSSVRSRSKRLGVELAKASAK